MKGVSLRFTLPVLPSVYAWAAAPAGEIGAGG